MIVSKYTFFEIVDEKCFLFNSLTKAIVLVDSNTYSALCHNIDNSDFDATGVDDETLCQLKEYHFIAENLGEDEEYVRDWFVKQRKRDDYAHITIAPTMDCCFSCYYCFERKKTGLYIADNIIEEVTAFICNQTSLKHIHITWFGGEPLLAIAQIKMLYDSIRTNFGGEISSDIISTAFIINKQTIETFRHIGLQSIQITLDGTEERHNAVKKTSSCKNVFQQTINNIKYLVNNLPNLFISVRVNITKNNEEDFVILYYLLKNINKKISVTPSPVLNRYNDAESCNLFNNKSFWKFVSDLYLKNGIITPLALGDDYSTECAIRHEKSFVIAPNGKVYKCWEAIDNPNYSIGELRNGKIQYSKDGIDFLRALDDSDPLKDERCSKCSYLPICFGGCPLKRIENLKNMNQSNNCTIYKNRIQEWLRLRLSLNEQLSVQLV